MEKILRTHEQVADVAVVGRADPVHTEHVVAVIVPAQDSGLNGQPSAKQALANSLRALCRQHLAPIRGAGRLRVRRCPAAPPLGKLLRRELRESALHLSEPVPTTVGMKPLIIGFTEAGAAGHTSAAAGHSELSKEVA